MIKLCHIISGDLWAGAEVMACHLLRAQAGDPELQLSVLLLNEGRLAAELRAAGCAVTILDEKRHGFASLLGQVRGHLKKMRPDLIHSHRYKENLLALLGSAGLGARLVATQHGLPEVGGVGSPLSSLKVSLNFALMRRFFGRTVAVSDDIRNYLVMKRSFAGRRVAAVRNGVPVPSGAAAAHNHPAPLCVGSSGRLFPVKDYPLMVEVTDMVRRERDVVFRLAGEGPCRDEILAAVERHGLRENFTLTGHLDAMEPFYRGLDLYLNTSLHEGIPMTILEAMACGLPVVAPAVGGIGEIVTDGVEGYLVRDRDPASFARRLIELVDDAALRAAMSRAARQKVGAMFSVEKMAKDYQRVYRELLAD
ncbi:glycosyltransferase family 4 protein [Geomonas paludis]|uniref:Glycosyl transferase family 1 n=1 Tax=Geomonas paludis TaxID=2740185 RepID=A0A6V8MU34_9BACT|nr:glycosyltransferase family 4 protein [Geomonas paludis]UPU37772.1 glycosyltransferase family 4 protein [Geomonas paludis]GFO63688.1 glycosyl transferase family 1 [Geomonas paludis]